MTNLWMPRDRRIDMLVLAMENGEWAFVYRGVPREMW